MERCQTQRGADFSAIGKEWRELSSQEKEKYRELARKDLEDYHVRKEEFVKSIEGKNGCYRVMVKRKVRKSAYTAMVMDRVLQVSSADRFNYVSKTSKEEYKNLPASKLEFYKQKAETINQEEIWQKPHKMSAYNIMAKERASKVPKEDRKDYVFKTSTLDYSNLSKSDLQEYRKKADDYNKARIKQWRSKLNSQGKKEAT